MNTEEKYELIEKYLHGELTGTALDDFEKALKNDPELEEELSHPVASKPLWNHIGVEITDLREGNAAVHVCSRNER